MAELDAAVRFLGLRPFGSCREFDFESCHRRFAPFESRGDSAFDGNAHYVHGAFDAHAERFSPGIELLLRAQATVEPFGLAFLPLVGRAEQRSVVEIARRVLGPKNSRQPARKGHAFDVAVSFAGPERQLAE